MTYPIITGLDIGHHSIKLVSIRLIKDQLELIDTYEVLLPKSIFLDINNFHLEEIIPYLQQFSESVKNNQKQIAFAISDNNVMSKIIKIDAPFNEKETVFNVMHTFEQQTSLQMDELRVDFFVLDKNDNQRVANYQVVAVKKELIDNREKCFKKAGFFPVLADVHSFSLSSLWRLNITKYPNFKDWMMIDLGYCQTIFCAISPTNAQYTKQIIFGTLSLEESTESPLSETVNQKQYASFVVQLSDHIQRQITLYSSIDNYPVKGICLTGGGSMSLGLIDLLSKELLLPVIELNLSSLFKTNQVSSNTLENKYASAAGLALRGIEWLTK